MDVSIGERIRKRRNELHITQTQVQKETGISSGNLSGIEAGRSLPSASALIGLSKMLDCTTDWILTGVSPISENTSISNIEEELLNGFRELPEDDRDELLCIMQMKLRKVKKENSMSAKLSGLTNTEKGDMVG